ncbi:MAG: LysR family transcriptional regulator [Minicystis sp.]
MAHFWNTSGARWNTRSTARYGGSSMLDDLDLFLCVAAHGSLNRAAKQLRLPKSTVSRRLASLEDVMGASLFLRDAAGLTLTHAGATLRAECEGPMSALRDALAGIRNNLTALRGTVRVALPRTFATFVCPPVLRAFAERHPDVILELDLDDAVTDPAVAGWDASIRIGPLPPGDLRVRVLGEVRGVLVATPAYLARHGSPEPDTLAQHRGVVFRSAAFGARWDMLDPAGAPRAFELPVAMSTNDLGMLREAALLGLGVARAPRYVVAEDLRAGRLVEVMPGWTTTPRKVHALHPQGRRLPARVRIFLDHVALALRGLDLDLLERRAAL